MGHRLGLRVDKEDGELFILEVQPGLVQEWNEANPDCQVGHATMGRVEECGGIHWKYNGSTMKYPFVGDKISKLSRKVIEKQGVHIGRRIQAQYAFHHFRCRSGLEMSFLKSTAKVATHGH